MSIGWLTILLFTAMMVLLIPGLPMAFSLASVAILFTLFAWGTQALPIFVYRIYGIFSSFTLIAIPLFITMGTILQQSGIAEDLFTLMQGTIGRMRGGLAVGTEIICTIFAAMTGVSGASTVTMGVVALPEMLKRGYHKDMAIGCIAAGGALGILIPPSITFIVYGQFAEESVGKLFASGVFPGLLLASMFITYIAVRAHFQPAIAPSVARAEAFGRKQTLSALRGVILPVLIIIAVLGSIFTGIATPTEASSVGALGTLIAALIRGKFSFEKFKQALYSSFRINSMVFWILLGASLFVSVYTSLGAPDLITKILTGMPVNRWYVMIVIQLSIFVLGMFLEPLGIVMITTPIYVPVLKALGFDMVWYGCLFVMNMEMAYLTPPFGGNLFYLKGVAPPEVTMVDIYRSIGPFVVLQAIGLVIVMIFPQIALFLPHILFPIKTV